MKGQETPKDPGIRSGGGGLVLKTRSDAQIGIVKQNYKRVVLRCSRVTGADIFSTIPLWMPPHHLRAGDGRTNLPSRPAPEFIADSSPREITWG